MGERRPARVAHAIQAELGLLLLRAVKDPRLQQVTVTAVRMTPDLRVAHVFVRTLGSDDPATVLTGLRRATAFLRYEVGQALGLRVTPELRFAYDTVPDEGRRVDELLRTRHPLEDPEEPE